MGKTTHSPTRRSYRNCLLVAVLFTSQNVAIRSAPADVVVLANRAGAPLLVQVAGTRGLAQDVRIPPGDSVPVFLDGRGSVSFPSGGRPKRHDVDANCAYFFGRTPDGHVALQKIGLGEDSSTLGGRPLPGTANRTNSITIPVKILVDEEEPARRVIWERRLRSRIDAASAILDKHCRVRLKVVAAETWNSDNTIADFFESLGEFEREVDPGSARLAIGFTSQFQVLKGRVHMAGTRGPLRQHILLREFSPKIDEPERLEFLVHELGHHLGASHSPEPASAMRPVLGDNLAGRADFPIRIDPVNTLIMSIVGEEMRRRNIRTFADLTNPSKFRLRQIYGHLAPTLPDDPAGNHFLALTNGATGAAATRGTAAELLQGTRYVLSRLTKSAEANSKLPAAQAGDSSAKQPAQPVPSIEGLVLTLGPTPSASNKVATRRTGDALMEFYVREAAAAADDLPAATASKAFLLALGIALDDTGALTALPMIAPIMRTIEAPAERAARTGYFGQPTMLGRADLAKHFAVSACLAHVVGTEAARAAGITKETLDAQRDSGFSFADITANQAGIVFADFIMKGRFSMTMIEKSFSVPLVMPAVDGLAEGLSSKELLAEYGPASDARFRQQLLEIDQRVRRLPPYRVATELPNR